MANRWDGILPMCEARAPSLLLPTRSSEKDFQGTTGHGTSGAGSRAGGVGREIYAHKDGAGTGHLGLSVMSMPWVVANS